VCPEQLKCWDTGIDPSAFFNFKTTPLSIDRIFTRRGRWNIVKNFTEKYRDSSNEVFYTREAPGYFEKNCGIELENN
jgi:hypothetical protein